MKLSLTTLRIVRDRALPNRPVRRNVRGIEMLLPRRHVLPYMATPGGPYAQNLVDLAAALARTSDDLVVLDVGANVGDSALLILDQVRCRVVCVEGDPAWLIYLEQNVGSVPDVAIEAALLSDEPEPEFVSIVHASVGTSHVLPATGTAGVATLPVRELPSRHPELSRVRLVKSDTDGFDTLLAVAYAKVFSASKPVIFFEYDPRPTRLVAPQTEAENVWGELVDEGYTEAVVWTNGGHLLGRCGVDELRRRGTDLERGAGELGYHFWDVAVAHRDDPAGIEALDTVAAQSRWVFPASWA